jgi:hypothetical protein
MKVKKREIIKRVGKSEGVSEKSVTGVGDGSRIVITQI